MALQFIENWNNDSLYHCTQGGRWDILTNTGNNLSVLGVNTLLTDQFSGKYNDGCLRWFGTNSATSIRKSLGASFTTVYLGFWWKPLTFATQNNISICGFIDDTTISGSSTQVTLGHLNGSPFKLNVWRGDRSVSLGSSAGGPTLNVWTFIEIKVTFSTTVGVIEVKQDGVDVIGPLTSQNTAASGNPVCSSFYLGCLGGSIQTGNYIFSHLYFADSSAGNVTGFLGPIRVTSLTPTANGTFAQFTTDTPNTGANSYKNLLLYPSSGNTLYNSDLTSTHKDTFNHVFVPPNATTMYGVQSSSFLQLNDGGPRTLANVIYDGTNEGDLTPSSFNIPAGGSASTTNFGWLESIQEYQLPSGTTQMTPTYVNNLQTGYKITS